MTCTILRSGLGRWSTHARSREFEIVRHEPGPRTIEVAACNAPLALAGISDNHAPIVRKDGLGRRVRLLCGLTAWSFFLWLLAGVPTIGRPLSIFRFRLLWTKPMSFYLYPYWPPIGLYLYSPSGHPLGSLSVLRTFNRASHMPIGPP